MKYIRNILFCLIAFPFLAWADVTPPNAKSTDSQIVEAAPDRLFIGADLYYQNMEYDFEPHNREFKNAFYGLDVGYEYRKPDSIYGRFELNTSWKNSKSGWRNLDSDTFNFGAEGRVGYNFSEKGLDLIPYFGFGYYQLNTPNASKISWQYPLLGFWINYAFTNYVELGLNIKMMFTINAKLHPNDLYNKGSFNLQNHFQYAIELPTTFYLDDEKKWDLRITPYFTQKNLSGVVEHGYHNPNSQNPIPYTVSLPDLDIYQVGGRIEVGYHF